MIRPIATCCLLALLAACKPSGDAPHPPPANVPTPSATSTQAKPSAAAAAGRKSPTLHVTTLDGARYDLAAHRGHWVVVNFWATWCAPCLKEMPELSALDAMREHIEVIGLAYDDIQPAELKAFLRKHPVVYPIAIVDTYAPPADFDTPRGLPTTYLIAPDGSLAKQFLGPVTAHDIDAAIAAAGGPKAG
ncbi:MAG: TlpA family protein disulfide reductase [Luteimonas sp.]